MIRVLVVDDHAVVRTGLMHLLATAGDMECVGQAAEGEAVPELVARLRPDVVLLDLSMPGADGVTVIRDLRAAALPARILVLTSFSDAGLVLDAVHAGADGYLLKQSEGEQILDGVRTVAAGGAPVDPAVARSLLRTVRERGGPTVALTERETEVLELIRLGYPNKTIARRLQISERTVKAHVTHILQRIGVPDRTQAALWAERNLHPPGSREAPS
ncbi:response regulator [Geodermatophilus ruber]|uniref:Two component transcriptional regulator, LuxR family n=1 Tax=Geodermatophilus ruber TaxID=504800 RepID=A0A1I4FEZ8_9ACTN|nr:response regulator transcription factor [Geodermatophilus ruber]SFL15870.1 two component transcriptional regulator, LuxR family [Geodermatophilus ruber]